MKSRHRGNGKVNILIAEDSATQRERLKHLLEEDGHAVVAAANGRAAYNAAQRERPTLIISDIVMPELDGYGLCKAIRSDEKLKDVPVILLTTLSDPRDILLGLECGADNFIRKPYDGKYLLSRIDYVLMNLELRKNQKVQMGAEVNLGGRRHFITAERQQILDLLISTYEQASYLNGELKVREKELAHSNDVLNALYRIAEGLNHAGSEREVAESVLERALELPGIQAGWISLREGESGFRLAAVRNLPPALDAPGAMDGDCTCRRRLISGELDAVTNILECERLGKAGEDARGLSYHASIPLWLDDRTLGVMNLVGPEKGLFNEEELKVLYSVGNQVAVALERARLHEHLESLVRERTAALEAEIAVRKRIEKEQARLVAIIEATPDMVATASLDGYPLYCNRAGLSMLGFESERNLSAVRIMETHPEWAAKLVAETGIPHAIEHGSWSGETALLRRNGREIPVSQVIIAHRGEDGSVEYLSTIARDISVRKEHEKRITRLNRVYAVLSGINMTIVRTRDRQALFDASCRIAVEEGLFRLAWIGLLDAEGLDVAPVARAGVDDGYLDNIQLTARDDAPDRCEMVARALRDKTAVVCNDIDTDPQMARWREEALRRGYQSVVVFPLQLEDKVTGLLLLYASEPGFFDMDEMRLLTEIAGDISFALDNLEKEARLDYLAYYDALTGLANRTLFLQRLEEHLFDARASRSVVALLIMNIDRFKMINDALGRTAGDELLRQIAGRIVSATNEPGRIARIGGDVFAVMTFNLKSAEEMARRTEQRMEEIFGAPFEISGTELRVSVRFGISVFPDDGGDAETLFKNAEAALKKARVEGERYLFYTQKMSRKVAENLALENQLRRALEKEEFVLHYQPKVDLETRTIVGVEALIRWMSPEHGLVPPFKFIPLLEETGLILPVGAWALRRAAMDHQYWVEQGVSAPRVAVNVSPIQLRRADFVASLKDAISQGASPHGLDLEITETLIMEDIEASIEKLKAARDLGIGIAIDDFGTGYSSLAYLAKLPVQTLKIDRAFIITMLTERDVMTLVRTMISLAQSLRLTVIAEGVEEEEQAKTLHLLGCDQMQGYLFSRPVPREEITAMLNK